MPRLKDDSGFTLIELLVVILIIGILAALALPVFLRQQDKADDSKAKTDARGIVTVMETCYIENQSYLGCSAQLGTEYQGIKIGTGLGRTAVTEETSSGYSVTAVSKAGASHTFTIDHTLGETFLRTCGAPGEGGCEADGRW